MNLEVQHVSAKERWIFRIVFTKLNVKYVKLTMISFMYYPLLNVLLVEMIEARDEDGKEEPEVCTRCSSGRQLNVKP